MGPTCWARACNPPPLPPSGRCNANLLDFDKASPLHLALEAGDEAMVAALLGAGADPDLANPDFK